MQVKCLSHCSCLYSLVRLMRRAASRTPHCRALSLGFVPSVLINEAYFYFCLCCSFLFVWGDILTSRPAQHGVAILKQEASPKFTSAAVTQGTFSPCSAVGMPGAAGIARLALGKSLVRTSRVSQNRGTMGTLFGSFL